MNSARTEKELRFRKAMYQGYGNGLARGFEIMAIPVLFALMGLGIDSVFGTKPIFLVTFAIIGAVGVFVREWYAYAEKMRAHDENAIWGKR